MLAVEEPGRSSDVADQGAFAGNAGDSLLALRAARGVPGGAGLPKAGGFWRVAGVLFLLFFAAAAPAPLYGVYQAEWRFSAITLTAVLAVYALLRLVTLLMFGSVSDYLGRRRVILADLTMTAGACGLFLAAHGAGLLFAARALQGAAVGTAVSALGAALIDLQPEGSGLAPMVTTAASMLGLAAGGLGTSALVQYGPAPTRLVWWLLLGVSLAAAIAGAGVTLAAIETASAAAFLAGTALAGEGFGTTAFAIDPALIKIVRDDSAASRCRSPARAERRFGCVKRT